MAVLQKFWDFFSPTVSENNYVVPAPYTTYNIRPLTIKNIEEVWKLNQRCFQKHESYSKYTFNYLLSQPNTLSYRLTTANGELAGFIVIVCENGVGHITTIGIAPEHRRRGLANLLLTHIESSLLKREINTIVLEVRVSNIAAQSLYRSLGYAMLQRINKYYTNGEDGYMMMKSLI
ncbi:MAG: ribosomal protein S18-alanine N-acetyltransferase [Pyrinomonadaceae bacterium]|jgi:ribosomal-protein-alanine N-acetyltransferase|nr:ribosomal protein S18-alanine N-acetyltransferase [Pyrinomonadaceae bacterium]